VGIIIFAAVWALILAAPKTRTLLYSQLGISQVGSGDLTSPSTQEIRAIRLLAKRYPNDAKVQALLIQDASTNPKERLRKYDNLIERFPNTLWLIQDRLRQSTSGKFKVPTGSYAIENNGTRTYLQSKNWLSPAEIRQTLKIVFLGEKQDPQNTFYNWIEAMCWYGLNDNSKALDAFQRGSRKNFYDDGTFQDIKNRLYVYHLIRPVLVEDRWLAMASELFPHYARMRNFTRAAVWQGGMQEKEGNHQRALDIYGAQLQLSATMFRNSKTSIGKLVARAMIDLTWLSLTRKMPGDEAIYESANQQAKEALWLNQAQRFADYANSHGRADLANQAISIANDIIHDPLISEGYPTAYTFLVQSKCNSIGLLKWTGTELLKVLLIGIAVWICIFPLFYLLNKALLSNSKFSLISIKPFDIVLSTMFVLLCVITGVVFVLSKISDKNDLYTAMFSPQFVFNSDPITMFNFLTTWIPWVAFVLLFVCSFLPICWKLRKYTFHDMDLGITPSKFITFAMRFIKVLSWIVLLAFQVVWTMLILDKLFYVDRFSLLDYSLYLTIPVPIILFFILRWYLLRPQTPRIVFSAPLFWLCFLTMLQQSLTLWILICSLSYGLTTLVSLPLRHQANGLFDKFLNVGEVKVLEELIQHDRSQKFNNS